MRWNRKVRPKDGDIKYVRRFLWFPLKLDGETRWLETTSIKLKWVSAYGYDGDYSSWKYVCWAENDKTYRLKNFINE